MSAIKQPMRNSPLPEYQGRVERAIGLDLKHGKIQGSRRVITVAGHHVMIEMRTATAGEVARHSPGQMGPS